MLRLSIVAFVLAFLAACFPGGQEGEELDGAPQADAATDTVEPPETAGDTAHTGR